MNPVAPVTSVGFTNQRRGFYRSAQLSILKLSASRALIPSAADGS
jgi:hypothetical protein